MLEKVERILSSTWHQGVDDERDRKEGGQEKRQRLLGVMLHCFHLCMMYSYICNVLPLQCIAHKFHKRGQCLLNPGLGGCLCVYL